MSSDVAGPLPLSNFETGKMEKDTVFGGVCGEVEGAMVQRPGERRGALLYFLIEINNLW